MRPIVQRLLQCTPRCVGRCVGAFGECSHDLHSLLHDTVHSAADRHARRSIRCVRGLPRGSLSIYPSIYLSICWREAGATSARAAASVYTAIYRRRWGRGARPRCRVRGCGSRARTSRLVATPGMRAAPPVRPSTQEMLTISRPPPRRCSAACLLGSATRHFSSALFSPTAGCPVTMVHVFFFFFFFFLHPGRVRVLYTPWAAGSARRSALPRVGSGNARARSVAGHREQR